MIRRLLLWLFPALGAAACADPAANYLGGFGDPVRGAALHAPWSFGDTASLAGRPREAALAVVQLEFLDGELRENPRYASEASITALHALRQGVAEMRGALGIRQDAPRQVVIDGMRDAASALEAGSPARAEAALSSPAFTLGPAETLARLSRLPSLPRAREAASAASAEILRLDGGSRRR